MASDTAAAVLSLPSGVVSPGDLRKLGRELEQLEDSLTQIRLRQQTTAKLPRASRLLEEFAATNRLNLLMEADRNRAAAFVRQAAQTAPVLHMSFAAEPSRKFTTAVVVWLRLNVHPEVLLNIGLAPEIAAGCLLRTPVRQYDFSLRARLQTAATQLAESLRLNAAAAPAPAEPNGGVGV